MAGGALAGAPSSAFTGQQSQTGPDLSGWSVATGGGSVTASRGEPAALLGGGLNITTLALVLVAGVVLWRAVRK